MITIQEVPNQLFSAFAQCVYNSGVSLHMGDIRIADDGCAYITRFDKVDDEVKPSLVKLVGELHPTINETIANDYQAVEDFMAKFSAELEAIREGTMSVEDSSFYVPPADETPEED